MTEPRPRGGLRRGTPGADGATRSRCRIGRPREERGRGRHTPGPRAPPRPKRRTCGPEDPSTRTPVRGWSAEALRWQVTFASRSVGMRNEIFLKVLKFHVGSRRIPRNGHRNVSTCVGHAVPRLPALFSGVQCFRTLGFRNRAEGAFKNPQKKALHRRRIETAGPLCASVCLLRCKCVCVEDTPIVILSLILIYIFLLFAQEKGERSARKSFGSAERGGKKRRKKKAYTREEGQKSR